MGRLTRRECAGIVFGSRQQYEIGLLHRNRVGSEGPLFFVSHRLLLLLTEREGDGERRGGR